MSKNRAYKYRAYKHRAYKYRAYKYRGYKYGATIAIKGSVRISAAQVHAAQSMPAIAVGQRPSFVSQRKRIPGPNPHNEMVTKNNNEGGLKHRQGHLKW